MPTIPQEYVIAISAAVGIWLILKIGQTIVNTWSDYVFSRPSKAAEYQKVFELAWQYGEQLLEKHGAGRENIENVVLDWAVKYMLSVGITPPARDVAVGIIRAVGKQYHETREKSGGK